MSTSDDAYDPLRLRRRGHLPRFAGEEDYSAATDCVAGLL
jgi:hypothetical protein